MSDAVVPQWEPVPVPLAQLKDHPRNYRAHPEDQLAHLCRSIQEHGLYRPIVVAQDDTILAGHGVALAAARLGIDPVAVVRLPVSPDSPAALQILVGDNEIEHLADRDDRLLSELLKEIGEIDPELLTGTGYDAAMLANLVFVTRPASEIQDFDEAAHWVGMPEYETPEKPYQLIVSFDSEAERAQFITEVGLSQSLKRGGRVWSARWPDREGEDLASLKYEVADA